MLQQQLKRSIQTLHQLKVLYTNSYPYTRTPEYILLQQLKQPIQTPTTTAHTRHVH
jgi:hypothetical protein